MSTSSSPSPSTPTSELASRHLLLVPIPAWGHIRPLCLLAMRILQERPDSVITFISAPNFLDKTSHEFEKLAEGFRWEYKEYFLDRIRVVCPHAATEKTPGLFESVALVTESFPPLYTSLLREEPITCAVRSNTFTSVPAPCVIFVDYFWTAPGLHTISKSINPNIPVIAWVSCGGATLIRRYGPEALGGLGDLGPKIDEEARRTGRDAIEVGNEMFKKIDGSVVRIPGLPDMYDWEYFPQNLPLNVPLSSLLREGADILRTSDAVLVASSNTYERETLAAIRGWIKSCGHPVYNVGPLLPPGYGEPQAFGEKDREIANFLEDKLSKHGRSSVLFISFGTVFWPTVPEYIEELVDSLIECQIPFIFCHASPFAQIPEPAREKARASGFGLLSPWAPQHAILNHPATGWFLTHGGYGGVIESLGSGVPMIFWPFNGDQPTNAIHVSTNLGAGIELLEVRTGHGLKPLKRDGKTATSTRDAVGREFRDVFGGLKGFKGAQMRKNAERLKREFECAWIDEGAEAEMKCGKGGSGCALKELRALLERWV